MENANFDRGRCCLKRRRDQIAHQIALTLITALVLLAVGGIWWAISPPMAQAAGVPIDPLLLLAPTPTLESQNQSVPAVRAEMPAPAVAQSLPNSSPEVEAVAAAPVIAPSPVLAPPPAARGPEFDGRPLRRARTIRMLVTAYSPDERSCGKWADNITASGYSVWTNGMKLVAADTRILPFGAVISVPGYDGGRPVPVLDRGGAIKGRRLDVLFPTHESALQWGKRWVDVTVWQYAD